MIKITVTYDAKLNGLDEKIRLAVAEKLTQLTRQLYEKVQENLNGKILNKQSGQLAESIQQTVETDDNPMVGTVFPEPASPKAWALEKGGQKSYIIVPNKAEILHWYRDGKHNFARQVLHPPSKEFAYLRTALDEMEPIVPAAFAEAIQEAIGRA